MTLKLATSLDGRIATACGESKWITGEAARRTVHALRAEHDAILVGVGTVLADDPELTVRHAPLVGRRQPARIVLDSTLRTPVTSRLAQTAAEADVLIFCAPHADTAREAALTALGVGVERLVARQDGLDLGSMLERLVARGLESLFVEGGGAIAASFLQGGLVDRLEWFRAPLLIGSEGRPAVGPLALSRLIDATRLRRAAVREVGEDLWESYVRA